MWSLEAIIRLNELAVEKARQKRIDPRTPISAIGGKKIPANLLEKSVSTPVKED